MKNLKILLIEDDTIEVMKLKRATTSLNLKHNISEANNGEEALKLLENKDSLPDIILLDLNMPKINGIEFLKMLKADERLKYIPTIWHRGQWSCFPWFLILLPVYWYKKLNQY